MDILRFAVASYAWPRRLVLDGAVSAKIWPGRGIVAGSSTATFEVKAYVQPGIDHMVEDVAATSALRLGYKTTMLTLHIDDFLLEVVERNPEALLLSLDVWA
eukprot:2468786-Lingulodinium_polyedra.AAC.1